MHPQVQTLLLCCCCFFWGGCFQALNLTQFVWGLFQVTMAAENKGLVRPFFTLITSRGHAIKTFSRLAAQAGKPILFQTNGCPTSS